MSRQCIHCGSDKVNADGKRTTVAGVIKQKYTCKNCGKNYSVDTGNNKFSSSEKLDDQIIVITAAQNNTEVNEKFLSALLFYCAKRNAKLKIIPIKAGVLEEGTELEWHVDDEYLLTGAVQASEKLRILSNLNILPSIDNPLSGLDHLSKGDSLIVGHTQLQYKTLAVNAVDTPAILTTTGVITKPNYTQSKQGEKARFNHSYSALVVEKTDNEFHIRVLNADDTGGFYDISGYYTGTAFKALKGVEALITGDEHALFVSPEVRAATYDNKDSIANTLKPKLIVRHDVLDCYSVSHHHKNSFFTRYGKFHAGTHKIEDELEITLEFIKKTTPKYATNLIVSSNHNDHLYRWLNEAEPKFEPWNAKIYHQLMYLMLDKMSLLDDGFTYDNPFELWVRSKKHTEMIQFIGRDDSYKICDIEISNHGDAGTNGSRGSLLQYSRLAYKQVIGHSHSPGIKSGAYQVGTSSKLRLEYVKGPSSWLHTHCVIYPNGKRQLISIINGNWNGGL